MKNQKFAIGKIFAIYGIIQAIAGAIAILVGVTSYASDESTSSLITAVVGLSAILLSFFVISWGIVVESVYRTANNTELLVKHCSINGILYDKSGTTIVYLPKTIQGSITVPDIITSIGNDVFSGCSMLTSITIPNNVTNIETNAFAGCSMLTNITVAKDNQNYCSIDGILYNKPATTIIHVPNAIQGSITLPNGITRIGDGTFQNCASLTNIVIPNSVEHIGSNAFSGCTKLTSFTLPNSIKVIGDYAFDNSVDLCFNGTKEEWKQIKKGSAWEYFTGNIHCIDGNIEKIVKEEED